MFVYVWSTWSCNPLPLEDSVPCDIIAGKHTQSHSSDELHPFAFTPFSINFFCAFFSPLRSQPTEWMFSTNVRYEWQSTQRRRAIRRPQPNLSRSNSLESPVHPRHSPRPSTLYSPTTARSVTTWWSCLLLITIFTLSFDFITLSILTLTLTISSTHNFYQHQYFQLNWSFFSLFFALTEKLYKVKLKFKPRMVKLVCFEVLPTGR